MNNAFHKSIPTLIIGFFCIVLIIFYLGMPAVLPLFTLCYIVGTIIAYFIIKIK